jgi:hypothetical protein
MSHAAPAPFMVNLKSLEELNGKKAYPKSRATRKASEPPKRTRLVPSSKQPPQVSSPPLLEPGTTADGLSAMACLKQLEDGELIGTIKWEESIIRENRQQIRLRVIKSGDSNRKGDLLFEHERNIQSISKKAVKQHLAALAMREIVGQWSEHSFKDLRRLLNERSNQGSARSDHST